MNNGIIENIISCMASSASMSDIQRIQTEHRLKLAEFWQIYKGAKVLEIGCGQGDTTAVLAYMVGTEGLVHGIDIASPNYGAPITLGDSAKALLNSRLGKQIKIDFEIDVLSSAIDFDENSFDYVVLSQCSWYMSSSDELFKILTKAKKWGKQLCFAEWDTTIYYKNQFAHFMAVLIQAHYECFKENSESNLRTLFTVSDIKNIASKAGWKITDEKTIHSPEMQDGNWEVGMVLSNYNKESKKLAEVSPKLSNLIESEISLLKEYVKENKIEPLSVFAFIGE